MMRRAEYAINSMFGLCVLWLTALTGCSGDSELTDDDGELGIGCRLQDLGDVRD